MGLRIFSILRFWKHVALLVAALFLLGIVLRLVNREVLPPGDYTETMPNSDVSFDMVHIPGGEFEMGSPEDEEGREPDEGPLHPVKLDPYWIGKCEVTWNEYEQYFLGQVDAVSGPSPRLNWTWIKIYVQKYLFLAGLPYFEYDAITRPSNFYGAPDHGWGRRARPMICISFKAAQMYCQWLSIKTGANYRLPTEAEWEYACRAGSDAHYFFGDDEDKLDDYAWYWDNSNDQTQPVGQKLPNQFGLHDMLGNVWEYCGDAYDQNYYAVLKEEGNATNPSGPEVEEKSVLRGGSWDDDPVDLRAANRLEAQDWWNERDPQRPRGTWWLVDGSMVGFRLVRSPK